MRKLVGPAIAILCVLFAVLLTPSLVFRVPTVVQLMGAVPAIAVGAVIYGLARWKGARFALFACLPTLLAMGALELGTRAWLRFADGATRAAFLSPEHLSSDLGTKSIYVPHHYTLYNLRPNLSLPEGTRHNRLGLRDHREFEVPSDDLRVVVIGGSTTYTIGIRDNRQIFSTKLEEQLNQFYGDGLGTRRIQVINAGMGSSTSAENLLRLMFFVSEVEPDLVIIQQGINDMWPRATGQLQSDFGNYRRIWGQAHRASQSHRPIATELTMQVIQRSVLLTYAYRTLRGRDDTLHVSHMINRDDVDFKKEQLAKNGTKYFERNTAFMIAICRSIGARVLLVSEPYRVDPEDMRAIAFAQHNQLLAKIAAAEGVEFFDFAARMPSDAKYLPDGAHVSQAGSDVKADLYLDYLTSESDALRELLEATNE